MEQSTFSERMNATAEETIGQVYRTVADLTDEEFARTTRELLYREMAAYVGEVQQLIHGEGPSSVWIEKMDRVRPAHVGRTYDALANECHLARLPEEHQQIIRQSLSIAFMQVSVAYMEVAKEIAKDELVRRRSGRTETV